MISSLDVAWFAGIIEGEGWISGTKKSLELGVGMTDKDVMEKISRITRKRMYHRQHGKLKDSWDVRLNGKLAASWLMTLFSFLGERRRGKATEALKKWYTVPIARRDRTSCSRGHTYTKESTMRVGGFRRCRICFNAWHRDRRKREKHGISQ